MVAPVARVPSHDHAAARRPASVRAKHSSCRHPHRNLHHRRSRSSLRSAVGGRSNSLRYRPAPCSGTSSRRTDRARIDRRADCTTGPAGNPGTDTDPRRTSRSRRYRLDRPDSCGHTDRPGRCRAGIVVRSGTRRRHSCQSSRHRRNIDRSGTSRRRTGYRRTGRSRSRRRRSSDRPDNQTSCSRSDGTGRPPAYRPALQDTS